MSQSKFIEIKHTPTLFFGVNDDEYAVVYTMTDFGDSFQCVKNNKYLLSLSKKAGVFVQDLETDKLITEFESVYGVGDMPTSVIGLCVANINLLNSVVGGELIDNGVDFTLECTDANFLELVTNEYKKEDLI